jgi:hypothetical protein
MMRNMIPKSTASAEPEQDRASGSEGGQKLTEEGTSADDTFGRESSNVPVGETPPVPISLLQEMIMGNGSIAEEADSSTISSSSSGFHSAHEEQQVGTDHHVEGRNAERDDDDGDDDDGDTDDENDDEPSRGTVTTAGGDEASQYIDIDDVLNFLSPSPRKLPVMLKRKGNQTTVVNVASAGPSDNDVPVESLSASEERQRHAISDSFPSQSIEFHPLSSAHRPNNPHHQDDDDDHHHNRTKSSSSQTGREDEGFRHASELSRFVVDVEASSRVSDDLSGPTFQFMDCDDSVGTLSSHRRGDVVAAADDGGNASEAKDSNMNSPELSIHKMLASSDCGADAVTTAPPSPDGPDFEHNWEVTIQGSRLREHEEEEPTPVASNRAVTVIHPGAILGDLDRLSAPLIAIEDDDDEECDDIVSMSDNGDAQSRTGLQNRLHHSGEEQQLSFDTNLSDSRNEPLDETHASSALELALALLDDDDDDDEEDVGSALGPGDGGSSAVSLGREDLDDTDEAVDRSAYDEALSLLANDSGEGGTLLHKRVVDDAADSMTRPVGQSIEQLAPEMESALSSNRVLSQDSVNDTDDERTVKLRPQHEPTRNDLRVDALGSQDPLPWMVRLNRLRNASVATMGTAARAIGPRLVDDALCIVESFRDAEELSSCDPNAAPNASSLPAKPPNDPTIERFATAASSTFCSALRSSSVAISDARDFVDCLADVREPEPPSVLSPTLAQCQSCEGSSYHVKTKDLDSFGSQLPEITSTTSGIRDSTTHDNFDKSLFRLVSAASSTSSSFVEVASPVLNDARDFASILARSDNPRVGECQHPRKLMSPLDCTPANATTSEVSSRSLRRFAEATMSAASTAVHLGTPAALDARDLAVNIISESKHPSYLLHANVETSVAGADAVRTNDERNLSSAVSRLASATSSAVVDSRKSWPSIVGEAGESVETLLKELRIFGEDKCKSTGVVTHSVAPMEDRHESAVSDQPPLHLPGARSSVSIEDRIGRNGASAVFRRKSDVDARLPSGDAGNALNSSPADECQSSIARSQQRRPPLFPRKSPYDRSSEKRFVEMVVSRLSSHSLSETATPSSTCEPDDIRYAHQSFNAKQSVFAEYRDAMVSPPGSPPVPATPGELNDDESLSLDGSGSIVEMPPVAEVSSTAKPNNAAAVLKASARAKSPLQLNQGAIDWGMGSFSSVKSELGVSTRHSASSKRRGPGRRFSLSSRGSGHGSHHGRNGVNPRQQSFRLEPRAIPHSLSEDALFVDSSFHDDHSETVSTGVQSSSPEHLTRDAKSLSSRQRHASTPDLQLLGRIASSATRERRVSLTPTSHSRRRLDRSVLSPESPQDFATLRGEVGGLRTMFLPLHEEALLEEALMKFSSFTSLEFPFVQDSVEECADRDLAWKQILACWKHRNVSESLHRLQRARLEHDTVSESDSSCTSLPFTDVGDLRLRGVSLDDLSSDFDSHLSYLTTLHDDVRSLDELKPGVLLRHELHWRDSSASALAKHAATWRQKFTSLVEAIANDALLLDGDKPSTYTSRGWYSCGLKEPEAIGRKAQRKYAGDVLRVKDILRARILFPDEGSLVAGLVLLKRRTDETTNKEFRLTIVRVKNALTDHKLHLPTGYRHILVNIRFSDGFLAGTLRPFNTSWKRVVDSDISILNRYPLLMTEIQFNVAKYFDVLGEDGYRLHHELCSRTAEQSRRADAVVLAVLHYESRGDCLTDSGVTAPTTVVGSIESAEHHTRTRYDDNDYALNVNQVNVSQSPKSDEAQQVVDIRSKEGALPDRCSNAASAESQDVAKVKFLMGLLVHGVQATAVNPRDLPSLICVHGLLLHLMEGDQYRLVSRSQGSHFDKDATIAHASKCILRSIAISSQAASLGMTGWLEYGSSAPFNRSGKLLFDLLYDLAACHANGGRWEGVVDALQATVAWCDEHEHPCHPRSLVALLDLSASLPSLGMLGLSTGILSLFYRRCSNHLATLEAACFERLNDQVLDGWKVVPTFRLENGPSPFSALESFCQTLHDLLNRRFASILGPGHPVIAHHRSVLGDAYSVLASCTSAAEALHGNSPEPSSDALGHWRMALDQYSAVFYGEDWSRSTAAAAASWYATAHRMARCLHELGNRDEALELLTTALSEDPATSLLNLPGSGPSDGNESASSGPSFVPTADLPTNQPPLVHLCVARASCHWLAAVLSAEVSAPPVGRLEGWTRAMSCLRSASHWYQSALRFLPPDAAAARDECLSQLGTVEEEARRLLALRDGPSSSSHHHYHHHHHYRPTAALTSRGTMPSPPALAWTLSHGSNASAW